MRTRILTEILITCVLSLGLTSGLIAQTFQGGVRGIVSDPGGAAIPNVKVTLIDEATNATVAAGMISPNPGNGED